jgi:uridine kinase
MSDDKKMKCSICGIEKDYKDYYANKAKKDGLRDHVCIECHKEREAMTSKEKFNQLKEVKDEQELQTLTDINSLYDNIDEGLTMAVFGASRSGKTTFLNHLYENIYKNYDIKIMMTPNFHKPIYKNFTKHKGILLKDFDDKLIRMLHTLNVKTGNYFRILIMMDDIVDEKYSDELKKCILTYRNANISTIISLQGHTLLNKHSRGNIHRFVFLKMNTNEEIQELIERLIMGMIKVPKTLKRVVDKIEYLKNWYIEHTKNYNMFLIDGLDNFKIYKYKTPM